MLKLAEAGALLLAVFLFVACGTAQADDISKDPVVQTAQSGAWSDSATWQAGRVPAAGDRVLVRSGHEVVYDVASDQAIRILKIAGKLRFASDRNTRLDVGLIRIEPGEDVSEEGFECEMHVPPAGNESLRPTLEVGTPTKPIDSRHTALIRLVYFDGMNKESCPAIVCCGGRMDFHGAAMNRTWVKLAAKARERTNEVLLAEEVSGWKQGDRILIPSTDTPNLFERGDNRRQVVPTVRDHTHTEERTIAALDGKKIVLDAPLAFGHRSDGHFSGEVANLSRNVIVESAAPSGVRGHTMYHSDSAGSISYAEFRHLGKKGVLGRYSLHFHQCRDTMRGSYVIGASIHDSDNRWLTIHGTDLLVVQDCVGYNSIGHGFFLEDGTEVFNVFDRNLAVQARHGAPLPKQILPFDENEGAGFWWSNSLNTFTRNVAAECDQYGFRFEAVKTAEFDPALDVPQPDGTLKKVDIRTLPFVRFEGNEAHSHRRFAFNLGGIRHVSDQADHDAVRTPGSDMSRIQGGHVDGVGPATRHPFVIRNLRVWESQWVFHGGSPCVLIDGLEAIDCTYGIFKTRMDAHEYRNLNLTRIDTAAIFEPWGRSTIEENYLRYLDPLDDLPPNTVITHCQRTDDAQILVKGVTSDNGRIKRVVVNGQDATPRGGSLGEWQVALASPKSSEAIEITAQAEDAAGNREVRPHRLTTTVATAESSKPTAGADGNSKRPTQSLFGIAVPSAPDKPVAAPASDGRVILPRSHQFTMRSRDGKREYSIQVAEPKGGPPEAGYPVLYALDGNAVFNTFAETVRVQRRAPLLIVGIGYPADEPFPPARTTDLAPARSNPENTSGDEQKTNGQDEFLSFIEQDLKPEIEKRFKINRSCQALFGHSLGGLFVLHVLYTRPSSFQTFLAGSPSIWWNDQAILSEERAFTSKPTPKVDVMLFVGANDGKHMVHDATKLAERLAPLAANGTRLYWHLFSDEDHVSVLPAAISRAVKLVSDGAR